MQRQYTVQVSSVQEMVYRTLRDKIVSMELKPGTIISTQEIADSMSVSRTPVREAFIRLQREELLDVAPQRSTMVSKINMDRVYQERFIREALEIEAMQKFVEVATAESLNRMRRNIEKQYAAIAEQRYIDFLELDNAFHQAAFTETHEDLGRSIVQQMNGHYDRIRLISGKGRSCQRPCRNMSAMLITLSAKIRHEPENFCEHTYRHCVYRKKYFLLTGLNISVMPASRR